MSSSLPVTQNSTRPAIGFFNHLRLAFCNNARDFHTAWGKHVTSDTTKNWLEIGGDAFLWHVNKLPQKLLAGFTDPRVVTAALTAIAMVSVQYAFYPAITLYYSQLAVTHIAAYVNPEVVKLLAYVLTQMAVLGLGIRTLGRVTNTELLQDWQACLIGNSSSPVFKA